MEIRALSRIAVAWLTVTLLALSVPPSPVLASGMAAACRNDSSIAPWDFHLSNFWAFKDADGANPHKWGIEGSFPALGGYRGLDICTGIGSLNLSSSAVWSALQAHSTLGDGIIQIGLMKGQGWCDVGTPCDSRIHLFWTWGECSGLFCGGPNGRGPEAIDLGVWDGQTKAFGIKSYWIVQGFPGWWPQVNGIYIANPGGHLPRTYENTAFLGGSTLRATWSCETWDRGDACGGSTTSSYLVGSMVVQETAAGAWVGNPVHADMCDRQDHGTGYYYHCITTSNSSMKFWTTR